MSQYQIIKAREKTTSYFYLELLLLELFQFPCQTFQWQRTGKVIVFPSFAIRSTYIILRDLVPDQVLPEKCKVSFSTLFSSLRVLPESLSDFVPSEFCAYLRTESLLICSAHLYYPYFSLDCWRFSLLEQNAS